MKYIIREVLDDGKIELIRYDLAIDRLSRWIDRAKIEECFADFGIINVPEASYYRAFHVSTAKNSTLILRSAREGFILLKGERYACIKDRVIHQEYYMAPKQLRILDFWSGKYNFSIRRNHE